jgi:hypothetical protein
MVPAVGHPEQLNTIVVIAAPLQTVCEELEMDIFTAVYCDIEIGR